MYNVKACLRVGAECPATGVIEAIITPHANSEYMSAHLTLISEATEFGRYALVIMDGAGWHQQELTEDSDNLSILKLPPLLSRTKPHRTSVAMSSSE